MGVYPRTVFEELEALGLSQFVPKAKPNKRGRKKKKQPNLKAKRSRGRTKKHSTQFVGYL